MFRLNIECTKDIDELHINFSDGTSAIVEKTDKHKTSNESYQNQTSQKNQKKQNHKKEQSIQDIDIDFSEECSVSQEKVELPTINTENRPVKVADELQNLDI